MWAWILSWLTVLAADPAAAQAEAPKAAAAVAIAYASLATEPPAPPAPTPKPGTVPACPNGKCRVPGASPATASPAKP